MKRALVFLSAILGSVSLPAAGGSISNIEPDDTYLYASKDGQDLMLDIYNPSEGSITTFNGRKKPTIIFSFGGGFKSGARNTEYYKTWFRKLQDDGFRVVSIDYRLGLKDVVSNMTGLSFIRKMDEAVRIAVEDLFDATKFLIDNSEQLGIDPSGIVISGSSAGAMMSMQAEWLICNGSSIATDRLPKGFNYAGVMSFAGAVFSSKGKITYPSKPCPILMLHGTEDRVVMYKGRRLGRLHFLGSSGLAKVLSGRDCTFRIYRFKGNSHEIASTMERNYPIEINFLKENVMNGMEYNVDATVSDPLIKAGSTPMSLGDLYGSRD